MVTKNIYYNDANIDSFKIWLDDDIVKINAGKEKWKIETIEKFMEQFDEFIKKLPKNQNVSIDISLTPPTPTSAFRKKIVLMIIKTFRDSGIKKVAIWGGKGVIRVVTSFFLTAAKIETIKHFKTEEEALGWLKED